MYENENSFKILHRKWRLNRRLKCDIIYLKCIPYHVYLLMISTHGARTVTWYNLWYCGTEGNSPMFPKIDWCKLGISTSLDLTDGFKVSWRGKIIILIT